MKHQWSTVGNIQKPTTLSVKKSQDDHDAQDANVVRPSTGHGFHQGTNLKARADRRDRSPRQTRGRQPRCEDQQRRHRRCPWRRPQQGHDALGAIVACPQHGHGFHQEQTSMPCRAGIQAPQGRRNPGPPTTSGAAAGTQAPGLPSARGAVAAKAAGRRRGSAPRAPAAAARPQADHPRRRRRGTATGRPPEAAATRHGHGPATRGGGDAARPRAGHPRRRRRCGQGPPPRRRRGHRTPPGSRSGHGGPGSGEEEAGTSPGGRRRRGRRSPGSGMKKVAGERGESVGAEADFG